MMNNPSFNKGFVAISVGLLWAALMLLGLPEKDSHYEKRPQNVLNDIQGQSEYVSVDQVAKIMMEQQDDFLLIDVRPASEYKQYHLPGALNIPLDSLLKKNKRGTYEWEWVLNQNERKNILYSNGNLTAKQAWLLTRRLNFDNNYVMQGGLNNWFATIINPPMPRFDQTALEREKYKFRLKAQEFFTGADNSGKTEFKIPEKDNTQQAAAQVGGC